jgi:hypothetical protein
MRSEARGGKGAVGATEAIALIVAHELSCAGQGGEALMEGGVADAAELA